MANNLNAENAYIFRIVHCDNIPWILKHGIHCGTSQTRDPNFVSIGNPDLIAKRATREVPVAPGGALNDYVPFYFTPNSPMMYNIKTGYNGITKRANVEIAILVSSIHQLKKLGVPFVFSDRHAYLRAARFSSDVADLERIDWPALQRRDFRKDPNDPEKVERYQAETLVHKCCPVAALLGIGFYDEKTARGFDASVTQNKPMLKLLACPRWYF